MITGSQKEPVCLDDFQSGYRVDSTIYWRYSNDVNASLKVLFYTNRLEKLFVGLLLRHMCENDVVNSGRYIKRMAFPEELDKTSILTAGGNFGSEFINRYLNLAYNLHSVADYELNDSFNHIFFWRPIDIMEFVKRIPRYTYNSDFRNSLRKEIKTGQLSFRERKANEEAVMMYENFREKCFGKPEIRGGVKSELDWSLRLCPIVLKYVLSQISSNLAFHENVTSMNIQQQTLRDQLRRSELLLERTKESMEAKKNYLEQMGRTAAWLQHITVNESPDDVQEGSSWGEDTSDAHSLNKEQLLTEDLKEEEKEILKQMADAEAKLPGDLLSSTCFSKNRNYNFSSILDLFTLMRNLIEHLKDCRPKINDNRSEELKKIDKDIFALFSSHLRKEKCTGHERSMKTLEELVFEYFAVRYPALFSETYVLAVNSRVCVDKAGHFQHIQYKLQHSPSKISNVFSDYSPNIHVLSMIGQAVSDDEVSRLRANN